MNQCRLQMKCEMSKSVALIRSFSDAIAKSVMHLKGEIGFAVFQSTWIIRERQSAVKK